MSLTEINVLMRFDNRTGVAVGRIRNPLRNLVLARGLSGIVQSNRRLREAAFDISVLQLPAEFLPVLSFWTDADAPVGKVLRSRVQGTEAAREKEFGDKLFACLHRREQLLNGYLGSMQRSSLKGYLPMIPAVWLLRSNTLLNQLRRTWNDRLVRRSS